MVWCSIRQTQPPLTVSTNVSTLAEGGREGGREGSSVYIRRASGLVFYKTDTATTHSQHKREYVSRGREGGREGGELCVHQEG